jgi:hypothetical protein
MFARTAITVAVIAIAMVAIGALRTRAFGIVAAWFGGFDGFARGRWGGLAGVVLRTQTAGLQRQAAEGQKGREGGWFHDFRKVMGVSVSGLQRLCGADWSDRSHR